MFPDNDNEYEEHKIEGVNVEADGTYSITQNGGWHLWCGKECPVVPQIGQTARLYGNGLGYSVRGLFINGAKAWYRSKADDKEHQEIQRYGKDAADLLALWDGNASVWSISMGGLGPSYEQCIQIAAFENLRWLLERKPDINAMKIDAEWKRIRKDMDAATGRNEVVKCLGLSGAQWGAAVSLATSWYMHGPRGVLNQVKADRHIQVQKYFPQAAAPQTSASSDSPQP